MHINLGRSRNTILLLLLVIIIDLLFFYYHILLHVLRLLVIQVDHKVIANYIFVRTATLLPYIAGNDISFSSSRTSIS